MSKLPDFAKLDLGPLATAAAAPVGQKWPTPEGISLKPIYVSADAEKLGFIDTYPGLSPFGRGPYPTMYVQQPWTIRQYAGFSTAEDSNAFYRRNLAPVRKASPSLSISPRTAAMIPIIRASSAMSAWRAWRSIPSSTCARSLHGIPLDQMSVSMTMNGAVLPIMALYIVAGEEQNVPHAKLTGTIQNDILKEFMVRNTYIYPPKPSMRIVSRYFRLHRARRCRNSIRSRSAAITCRKPARRPTWSLATRSPTASNMSAPGVGGGL